jgi:hypothetical protein
MLEQQPRPFSSGRAFFWKQTANLKLQGGVIILAACS